MKFSSVVNLATFLTLTLFSLGIGCDSESAKSSSSSYKSSGRPTAASITTTDPGDFGLKTKEADTDKDQTSPSHKAVVFKGADANNSASETQGPIIGSLANQSSDSPEVTSPIGNLGTHVKRLNQTRPTLALRRRAQKQVYAGALLTEEDIADLGPEYHLAFLDTGGTLARTDPIIPRFHTVLARLTPHCLQSPERIASLMVALNEQLRGNNIDQPLLPILEDTERFLRDSPNRIDYARLLSAYASIRQEVSHEQALQQIKPQ